MNSWEQREHAREILSKETGYTPKPHGGRIRIALAFPNTYWVGMSNLGFQTTYRLFNDHDDIVCERFFLPPKQELAELSKAKAPLLTLESQTPVADFDIVAFSVSFEWDYVNVLTLLRLAGIPSYAAERSTKHPLIVIGGAVTFVNPEPLAPFADVIAAGEGEALIPGLRRAVAAASDRAELLRLLATERGFYVPSFYEPEHAADGTLAGFRVRDRAYPRARVGRARALEPRRARVDCVMRSPGYRAHSRAAAGDGLRDQPGVAAARRSDRVDCPRAARKRRADDHHRARDRLRSAAARDQQDGHERRDPRSRGSDLRERDREPEALLHDRPPH